MSDPVARWLESPEGEKWSSGRHVPAHAGESHLPNHIASVRHAPGEDPFWDRPRPYRLEGIRNPENDPSGRPPRRRVARTRTNRGRSR